MLILETPTDILPAILWALCGLVVLMGGALVWVIKNRKSEAVKPTTGELDPTYWLVILNDLKAKLESVGKQIETLDGKMDDRDERKIDELKAIRSHLHEMRGLLSPLSLAVEYLTAEIKRQK